MGTAYPISTSLCQPHFAMWCKAKDTRIKFKQGSSGWTNNPINYYLVPGQHTSLLSLHSDIVGDPCHPAHQWWAAKLLGLSPTFCEDVWFMGNISRQWKRGVGEYSQIEEYKSPGHGVAPGVLELLPPGNCGGGKSCPPKKDDCCKQNGSNGPSDKMITPYWSKDFEDFIMEKMGRYQEGECYREYLKKEPHDCAKILETKNTPAKRSRESACGYGGSNPQTDCTFLKEGCPSGRNLKSGSATAFDRPPTKKGSSSSTWAKIGGAHLGKAYDSWGFTEYSMKYTNIVDPTSEGEDCSVPGSWDITWYNNGVIKDTEAIEICPPDPSAFPPGVAKPPAIPVKHMTAMHDPEGNPHYDPCWIGWTGGNKSGQMSKTAKGNFVECPAEGNNIDNPDGGGSVSKGAILPPVEYMRDEGPDKDDEDGDDDTEEHKWSQYWHKPKDRLFDYWALTGNQKTCINPNVGQDSGPGKNDWFLQHTVYFDDSAFMSISFPNNPPEACEENLFVQGWPIPCEGPEPQWKCGGEKEDECPGDADDDEDEDEEDDEPWLP